MVTATGNYIAGGNVGDAALPAPPPDRTPEQLAEWRARNEAKAARQTGIVRRTDQAPPAPAPEPVVSHDEPATPQPAPKPKPTPKPQARSTAADRKTARNLAIITAYTSGDTIKQIAKDRGHSPNTIRQVLTEAGITLRDDRKTGSGGRNAIEKSNPDLVDQVRILVDDGLTGPEIAAKVGVPHSTLGKLLSRNGIHIVRNPRTYLEEITAHGATPTLLRAFALSRGMEVGKTGPPGRKILTAWVTAGKPDVNDLDNLEPTPEQPPEKPVVARPGAWIHLDDDLAHQADVQLAQADQVLDIALTRPQVLPQEVQQALIDLLDLIERSRMASALTLKAALEAAGARIAATISPDPQRAES